MWFGLTGCTPSDLIPSSNTLSHRNHLLLPISSLVPRLEYLLANPLPSDLDISNAYSVNFIALMDSHHTIGTTAPGNAKAQSPNGTSDPAISIRYGAVQDKDVDMQDADADAPGASKRKSRASIDQQKSYAEPESSDDDDQPLVRRPLGP